MSDKIAKYGIVNGQKVLLRSRNTSYESSLKEGSFSRVALARAGFLKIAEKIAKDETLESTEVERIIANASLPVLMKLVELSNYVPEVTESRLVAILPMGAWFEHNRSFEQVYDRSCEYLQRVHFDSYYVTLNGVQIRWFSEGLIELLIALQDKFPRIKIVGPQIDDFIVAVSGQSDAHRLTRDEQQHLISILKRVRDSGIKHLRYTSNLSALQLTSKLGFINAVATDLCQFTSPSSLASHILQIEELNESEDCIPIWTPGVLSFDSNSIFHTQDFMILRLIAIGAIVLKSVPEIHASSKFLSLSGLHMAHLLGANSLMCGVHDEIGLSVLGLDKEKQLNSPKF